MPKLTAMWRMNHRRALAGLGALAVASVAFAGSGANFTSTSANPANTFTAGDLRHSNSKDGAAILTPSRMKPGETSTGTVDIRNTGDLAGVFTLSRSALTNSDAANPLSAKLDLVVEDLGDPANPAAPGAGTVRYTGKLGAIPTTALGTFAAGAGKRYLFRVTFPDGGAGGADNVFKGDSTSVQFDWESVSN